MSKTVIRLIQSTFLLPISALFFWGNNSEAAIPPNQGEVVTIMRVNNRNFTVQEYATFLQNHQDLMGKALSSDEGKAAIVREMAASYLLSEQLFKEGLVKREKDRNPTQQEGIKAYEALADKYFPLPKAPDEEVAYKYYQEHPEKYGIPETIRLNQILIKVNEAAPNNLVEAAKEKADKILKRLDAGESFGAIAEKESDNPIGRVTKGDIGFILLSDHPWLKSTLEGKKVGDRLDVVKTPQGFEVLQITDRHPEMLTPFANIHDVVSKAIRHEEQQKLRYAYVKEIAKGAKIEVLLPEYKKMFPNGMFP